MASCWQSAAALRTCSSLCGTGARQEQLLTVLTAIVASCGATQLHLPSICHRCVAQCSGSSCMPATRSSIQQNLLSSSAEAAVGFSSRNCTWHRLQGTKLAAAALSQPVSHVSFQPADPSCIITVAATAYNDGSGATAHSNTACRDSKVAEPSVQLWRLDKLWSRHELQAKPVQLPDACSANCLAWAPEVRCRCMYMCSSGDRSLQAALLSTTCFL